MYLIKYTETTDPTICRHCRSDDMEQTSDTESECHNCGETTHKGTEHFYLNHAYLSSCAFGSLDMAWNTDDKEKADLMLEKVQAAHPDNLNIVIEEY